MNRSLPTRGHSPADPSSVSRPLVAIGFTLLALSYMVNAMDRQLFYPLLPDIRTELGFSLPQGGLLATGFTLGMAVAGIPAGYLVDRFSRRSVLLVSIFTYSVGTMLTPLATGFADMAAYRLISGVGEGMQAAALYAAFGAYFFLRRSLAFGALGVAFGVGVFIGPIIGTEIADAYGTWRAPFVAFGAAGLLVLALIAVTVRRRLTEAVAGANQRDTAAYDHLPTSPYNRNTVALAVASVAGGLVFYAFLGLYPTFLRSELQFSAGQAALATSAVGAGAAMSLAAGWLGDRVDPRTLLIVTYVGVAASAWLVFNGPATPAWHYTFSFVFGAFTAGSLWTNCNSAMQRSVRPEYLGRAAGMFVASYYTAAAVSGLVFAGLVEALGWRPAALWQLTVLPLIAIGALWCIDSSKIVTRTRKAAA